MDTKLPFGERLKESRIRKGLKQSELAKEVGVSSNTISSYENGGKMPSLDIAFRIANALDESLDYMCSDIKNSRSGKTSINARLAVINIIELSDAIKLEIETPIDPYSEGTEMSAYLRIPYRKNNRFNKLIIDFLHKWKEIYNPSFSAIKNHVIIYIMWFLLCNLPFKIPFTGLKPFFIVSKNCLYIFLHLSF